MIPRNISQPFYKSKQWKICRRNYIQSVGGLCERCLEKGQIRQGYIVHHKKYITTENINDPYLTLNWDNLEYLCQKCHNREHFGENRITRNDVKFNHEGELVPVPPLKKHI